MKKYLSVLKEREYSTEYIRGFAGALKGKFESPQIIRPILEKELRSANYLPVYHRNLTLLIKEFE